MPPDLTTAMVEAGLTSPTLPENRADPYPIYHFMRALEPVHQAPDGSWVLTAYEHANTVLRDSRFSSNPVWLAKKPEAYSPRQVGSALMLFMDPPDHTRLRSLVTQAFTPRVVESMRPRIEQLVDALLDQVVERGEMDVLADIGYPLPTSVMCEMLGVPLADREQFKTLSADASRLLDGYLEQEAQMKGVVATMHLVQYFTDLIEERRRVPGTDLLSALIAVEEAGDKLTHEELVSTAGLLFLAGFETTMNLVGNGMLALLRHPDQLRRLRDDPTLIRPAVEELLRYDGPVHVTGRIATTDVDLAGHTVRKGQEIAMVLGAVHRDPAQFPDPDRLDVGRTPNRHLAFAAGPHFCLGAALARLEAQVAFSAILRRLPELELITTEPVYRDHFVIRGIKELRVGFPPQPAAA